MSGDDDKALEAVKLYASNSTFKDIAQQLGTSKSHAQVLVRRGISLLESEKSEPRAPPQGNPGAHQGLEETYPPQPEYPFPFSQNTRPGSYLVETSGVPKRIILTPKALMVFDIFSSCGFEGDLSDFIEDSIDYMYQTRMPSERGNHG